MDRFDDKIPKFCCGELILTPLTFNVKNILLETSFKIITGTQKIEYF